MAQKRNLELKKKKAEKDLEELTPHLQMQITDVKSLESGSVKKKKS